MSWNYNTSHNRVEKHLDDMGEIEVEKLVRDADLNSLLSETTCRDIFGAHVYVDVPNFSDLAQRQVAPASNGSVRKLSHRTEVAADRRR